MKFSIFFFLFCNIPHVVTETAESPLQFRLEKAPEGGYSQQPSKDMHLCMFSAFSISYSFFLHSCDQHPPSSDTTSIQFYCNQTDAIHRPDISLTFAIDNLGSHTLFFAQ